MPVVLNIDANSSYEPTETEIIEYAKWLGMNLPEDSPFLWIAREGLKAPLPENWKACQSDKGELYYFNVKSGESIWDHPMDDYFKTLFINEKKNPTPRSICCGSKCEHDQVQPTTSSRAKRRVEEILRETIHKENIELESNCNTRKLNGLKFKKELPKETENDLRVSVTKNELASLSEGSKNQNTKSCDFPNETFTEKQGKTSLPIQAISLVDINSIKESAKIQKRSKAENILSGPVKSSLDMPIEAKDSWKENSSDTGMQEINKFALFDTTDQEKRKETHQNEQECKIRDSEESVEEERPKSLFAFKKLDIALKNDQSKIESVIISGQEELKGGSDAHEPEEPNNIRESMKGNLMSEKKKANNEKSKDLEVLTGEFNAGHKSRRKIGALELKEFQTEIPNSLRECASKLLNEYTKAYTLFCEKVFESENDFVSRTTQQELDMQRRLDFELMRLKQTNENIIREETEKILKKIKEIRQQHHDDINTLYETNHTELQKLLQDNIVDINTKGTIENASMPVLNNSSYEVPQLAFDTLKEELEKGSEVQPKSAELKLAEQQETLSKPPEYSVHNKVLKSSDISSQEGRSKDFNKKSECYNTRKIRPLDETIICATSPEGNLCDLSLCNQNHDLKSIITKSLKEAFAEFYPIPSSQSENNEKYPPTDVSRPIQSCSPSIINGVQGLHTPKITFPAFFQEHHELIRAERRHVREGWMFVTNQRRNIEERRRQLRHTRHQWKQDVLDAKKAGVKSSSKRGQLLFKVRMALEEQAQGLQHDEFILHDSESWLLAKEQRLKNLERQIKDHENHQYVDENSSTICSLDTAGMVADFYGPQRDFTAEPLKPSTRSCLGSIAMFEKGVATQMMSKSLRQIEKRLDEITTIVKLQNKYQNPSAPSVDYKNSLTPNYSVSQNSRHCRHNFNTRTKEAIPKQIIHTVPL
ncbi:unnamed protein product [Phytomonas sp. EM1]|nr:unnamed protein product [Phytomonas sp. EM1]|eukprot:CCW64151.1 unnamed protein product [Phytomonas sp. isolate EM1]